MYISKYFTKAEMRCKCSDCGHSYPMDTIFLSYLDLVRKSADCVINVNSGFRCIKHNKEIGGAKNSWHTKGKAADCVPTKISLEGLALIARDYFNEVIVYDSFVHIAEPKIELYKGETTHENN